MADKRPGYGPTVTLAQAKTIAAAAVAEAKKNDWNVAVAIVDNHGFLVYFERLDDTQTASVHIAPEKARTAAMFRRPSSAFDEVVAKGRVNVLGMPGVVPVAGGVPIMFDGKVIGAIGVSGVASDQDEQICRAGLAALK